MMKKAIFFVLFAIATQLCFSQNLITNPGFESWDKSYKATGWYYSGRSLKDSMFVYSGKYSCRQEGTATTSNIQQIITVKPETTYTISFYYLTGDTSKGKGSRIWCYWKDTANVSIIDTLTDALMRPSTYLSSKTWAQFTQNIKAPAGAVKIDFQLRTNSNSQMYWDDVTFMETLATLNDETEIAPPVLYPNPASEYLHISNMEQCRRIDIQNMSGVIILTRQYKGENIISIPVAGLPAGIYIIRMHIEGKIVVRKFIKE